MLPHTRHLMFCVQLKAGLHEYIYIKIYIYIAYKAIKANYYTTTVPINLYYLDIASRESDNKLSLGNDQTTKINLFNPETTVPSLNINIQASEIRFTQDAEIIQE